MHSHMTGALGNWASSGLDTNLGGDNPIMSTWVKMISIFKVA